MAGATRMDFRRFALYSVVGGVAWTAGVTLLGFWLGQVPLVRDHVAVFIVGVVVPSLVPVAIEGLRVSTRRLTLPVRSAPVTTPCPAPGLVEARN
ncbi:hypothetical protein GCM10010531_17310 [Blastococcus jejuensis]|uniref:SNARE associated Golgi protein n=1 Tax=Blastococcus jejuensis TaxID=351224 RepID=A0ABP6P2A5_9ACTN